MYLVGNGWYLLFFRHKGAYSQMLDSLPHVTLTANTPWDPSQAFFHMHEMEEEEEVDQEAVRASVVAMYEKARRVAASVFSESDRL